MPIHLLATKFNFPPVRANLVPRPRLVERLNTGLKGQLTLISAPAGSGKTSLMSEWHATHGNKLKSAWISLDEADNDPVRFWLYLSTALATFQQGRFDSTFALLQSSQPVPPETIILSIIQELESFSNDCVLVLDDWHVIISPAIIKALNFLLDHLPPKLHLVLLTREDPPLPLARLRARNQLTEVRMADLRFTPDEASAFSIRPWGLIYPS